jgi:regulator of protease activity HflC (stomatin/prohibitin superfamily)
MVVATLLVAKASWRSVPAGRALVINKMRERTVSFTGAFVMPIVNRADELDLATRQIAITRRGRDGVICADNLRADITVTFFVRVNKTVDDVLRVAETIGCERASDARTLEELFAAKFSEAIKTVAKKLDFEQLFTQRDVFKDQIIAVIGRDLNGFVLDDAAIDELEQTPLEHLDPNHVLDAQGIRKIRERSVEPMHRPPDSRDLYAELVELGVHDVQVDTQLVGDVSAERAALELEIEGGGTELAKLPASVTRGLVEVVGRATLTIASGRATLRWRDREVTRTQLVAGARLVHAFRDGAQAYR